jgi:hypothetical protein
VLGKLHTDVCCHAVGSEFSTRELVCSICHLETENTRMEE